MPWFWCPVWPCSIGMHASNAFPLLGAHRQGLVIVVVYSGSRLRLMFAQLFEHTDIYISPC
jgi:hypothetical protein